MFNSCSRLYTMTGSETGCRINKHSSVAPWGCSLNGDDSEAKPVTVPVGVIEEEKESENHNCFGISMYNDRKGLSILFPWLIILTFPLSLCFSLFLYLSFCLSLHFSVFILPCPSFSIWFFLSLLLCLCFSLNLFLSLCFTLSLSLWWYAGNL